MVNKTTLTKPINKKVLLCSSGMDSYIIDKLEKPDICLFIDSKSNYSSIEKQWMIENKEHYNNLVILDDVLDLSMVELDNFIVPLRNLFFVAYGTYFGDEIILMRAGMIVQRGSISDLLHRPKEEFVEIFVSAQRTLFDSIQGVE